MVQAMAVPNPNPQHLYVEILGTAEFYTARLVTKAYTLIRSDELEGSAPGKRLLQLPAGYFDGLANGIYYIELQARRRNGAASPRRVVKAFRAQ